MTITPPAPTPITNPGVIPPYVYGYQPYTNITPFTYRDGATFLEIFEGAILYLNQTVIPFINNNFSEFDDEFTADMNTLIAQVNQQIADLTKYVDDTMQAVINDSIQVQDPVMAGIIQNPASQSRVALDAIYPHKSQTNALDYPSLQAAIDATATNGRLFIPATQTWTITSPLTVTRGMEIYGDGSLIQQNGTDRQGFKVSASNVTIRKLHIRGVQSASVNSSNETALDIEAVSNDVRISNINVKDCVFEHFGYDGIVARYVNNFEFSHNEYYDLGYSGVQVLSCNDGLIANEYIHNIIQATGLVNSYGVSVSNWGATPLAQDPQSINVIIRDCTVNGLKWEGLDTHGGINISFLNNIITACNVGIAIVGSKDNNVANIAAQNFLISGNTIDNLVLDGSAASLGLNIAGSSTGVGFGLVQQFATGIIQNNTIKNYGQDIGTGTAVRIHDTVGLVVNGNTLVSPSSVGIKFDYNNKDFVCMGNTLIDVWAITALTSSAIFLASDYNTGHVSGNAVTTNGKVATIINNRGLSIGAFANNYVSVGMNEFVSCTIPLLDPSNVSTHPLNAKKFGLYGVPPVVRPGPAPANATDLPTAIALVNNLKASLIALGLTS